MGTVVVVATCVSLLTWPAYTDTVKALENGDRVGYLPRLERWFPYKSAEGGNMTIGYGHKLTDEESKSWHILVADKVLNWKTVGLTEQEVDQLFMQDLKAHSDYATLLWDAVSPDIPFESLPMKYQAVIVDWVFATGHLHNKPLVKAIRAGDDGKVRATMVLHYAGKPMTKRRDTLADALEIEE